MVCDFSRKHLLVVSHVEIVVQAEIDVVAMRFVLVVFPRALFGDQTQQENELVVADGGIPLHLEEGVWIFLQCLVDEPFDLKLVIGYFRKRGFQN